MNKKIWFNSEKNTQFEIWTHLRSKIHMVQIFMHTFLTNPFLHLRKHDNIYSYVFHKVVTNFFGNNLF